MATRPVNDPYPTYYDLLADVHDLVRPRLYLEIGVDAGQSLSLVDASTRVVAVDPVPRCRPDMHPALDLVATTSAEFFADPSAVWACGRPVDLVFLDGLHHFEVTIADLLGAEALAGPDTVVLIHDCLPIDEVTSARERSTVVWSGDVWKTVVALRRHRPDLSVTTLDVSPTGMAVVTGFGDDPPGDEWVDAAVDELFPLGYADLVAMGLEQALGVQPATPTVLRSLLPAGCRSDG